MYVTYSLFMSSTILCFYFFIITLFFPFSFDLFLSFFPSGHRLPYQKIASFNCHGLNHDVKRVMILADIRKLDVQVILVQETFSKPHKKIGPSNGLSIRRSLIRYPKTAERPRGRQKCLIIRL